nr:immunoglobulin heavy chain junction region [Macaca mulatta]MOV38038.1 immunoglobulin heavy chain junction region [Macaca mulatta]MOV38435.1 immunoglobulin heavy chain junction region [Macaca mulatta]MOV38531.1 immunoglobulin heavy chain junction region [Macaca mulatta]MOV38809.1 immunoglobulin heavy chain junction region [Macaca mulatta]
CVRDSYGSGLDDW